MVIYTLFFILFPSVSVRTLTLEVEPLVNDHPNFGPKEVNNLCSKIIIDLLQKPSKYKGKINTKSFNLIQILHCLHGVLGQEVVLVARLLVVLEQP